MAATYLDDIVAWHRRAAAADRRDVDSLVAQALTRPPTRGFRAAVQRRHRQGRLAVVAEVKRRSPSKGPLVADLDPATVATRYAEGGATALSVLTDQVFFGGSAEDLIAARQAVDLPVLRKDFTVAPADVADARIMGADAVLLIVAALSEDELSQLLGLATRIGLDAVVEVHDEAELAVALRAGATLIGVNQRDLVTFEVDQARAVRLAAALPSGVVSVAESGITGPADAVTVATAGYHAVLVGESLVRAPDPAAATAALAAIAVGAHGGAPEGPVSTASSSAVVGSHRAGA